jgi:hypothetical protein
MWEVGQELKFDIDETKQIVDYLIGENLVEPASLGGGINLTHCGIKEIEEALENPDKATEHFLPMNIISIGTMNNSTLQQATINSTIYFNVDDSNLSMIDGIISSIRAIQDSLQLSNEINQELWSELQTLEIQRKSPKPKSTIMTEALKSLRTILEGIAGNAMAPIIVSQITKLIG